MNLVIEYLMKKTIEFESGRAEGDSVYNEALKEMYMQKAICAKVAADRLTGYMIVNSQKRAGKDVQMPEDCGRVIGFPDKKKQQLHKDAFRNILATNYKSPKKTMGMLIYLNVFYSYYSETYKTLNALFGYFPIAVNQKIDVALMRLLGDVYTKTAAISAYGKRELGRTSLPASQKKDVINTELLRVFNFLVSKNLMNEEKYKKNFSEVARDVHKQLVKDNNLSEKEMPPTWQATKKTPGKIETHSFKIGT